MEKCLRCVSSDVFCRKNRRSSGRKRLLNDDLMGCSSNIKHPIRSAFNDHAIGLEYFTVSTLLIEFPYVPAYILSRYGETPIEKPPLFAVYILYWPKSGYFLSTRYNLTEIRKITGESCI
jgi:hypothetical protein